MIGSFLIALSWLLIGHFVADMALQSDTMSKGKNRNRKPDYIPEGQKSVNVWPYFLTAHSAVHAGFVWVITVLWYLGLLQFISHWIIDFIKCENITNPHQDQFLHFIILIITAFIFVFSIKYRYF